jgi:hypothetical protein
MSRAGTHRGPSHNLCRVVGARPADIGRLDPSRNPICSPASVPQRLERAAERKTEGSRAGRTGLRTGR